MSKRHRTEEAQDTCSAVQWEGWVVAHMTLGWLMVKTLTDREVDIAAYLYLQSQILEVL